jgi:hypothetical protein
MSTYKGTMGYRDDMKGLLKLSYEKFPTVGRSSITRTLIASLMRGKTPYISTAVKVYPFERLSLMIG